MTVPLWRAAALAILCLVAGCSDAGSARVAVLSRTAENSVEVLVVLNKGQDGGFEIEARFEPTEPDLHLYDKDLPRDGVEGLGRPTLIEVSGGQILPTGELKASEIASPLTGDDAPEGLNTYPDGAVTLVLPVDIIAATGSDEITIEYMLTYMACSSSGGCMPPVEARLVSARVQGVQ